MTVDPSKYPLFPREKLVFLSKDNPNYLDARPGTGEIKYKKITDAFGEDLDKYFMPISTTAKYKYAVSFDGVAASWRRPAVILASKSVLLYNTDYQQYFNPYLKEWEHYVPIKDDCSDLKEKIDYLRKNPEKAKQIGENAAAVANEILSPEFIEKYWTKILLGIQERFDGEV